MIKEVFVLKSNSWHVWLMKWIWGFEHTEFRSMCNYTWLTVLNIILLPFFVLGKLAVAFFKLIHKVFHKTFEAWEDYCDKRQTTWLEQQLMKIEEDLDKGFDAAIKNRYLSRIINIWTSPHLTSHNLDPKTRHLYWTLNEANMQRVRAYADKVVSEKITREQIERAARKAKQKERREMINKLATYGKYIAYAFAIAIAFVIGYILYLGVMWLVGLSWYSIFMGMVKAIIVVLSVALALFILYWIYKFIVYMFCKIGPYCIPCEERRETIKAIFRALFGGIGSSFVIPFKWLWQGLKLLWEIAVELKKSHCPAIEWKDDE